MKDDINWDGSDLHGTWTIMEPPSVTDELEEARTIALEAGGIFTTQEVLLATLISLVRERL